MRRLTVTITTAADGTAIGHTPRFSGKVHSIHYAKASEDAYADTVDFAITAERTGENVWTEANVTASTVRYPRAPTHSQAGAAALYAAGGTGVLTPVALANDRLKISLAQGGNAKVGTFYVLVD